MDPHLYPLLMRTTLAKTLLVALISRSRSSSRNKEGSPPPVITALLAPRPCACLRTSSTRCQSMRWDWTFVDADAFEKQKGQCAWQALATGSTDTDRGIS